MSKVVPTKPITGETEQKLVDTIKDLFKSGMEGADRQRAKQHAEEVEESIRKTDEAHNLAAEGRVDDLPELTEGSRFKTAHSENLSALVDMISQKRDSSDNSRMPLQEHLQTPYQKGVTAIAYALKYQDGDRASKQARDNGYNEVAKILDMTQLVNGAGLVPPNVAQSVIEELGASAVVRRLPGIQTMVLEDGNLTLPYGDASATATWDGEQATTNESSPTFAEMQLREHNLTSVVVVTDSLLRNSIVALMNYLQNHLRRVKDRTEDLAFLRSDGSANRPKGLRQFAVDVGSNFDSGSAGTATKDPEVIIADLVAAAQAVEDADVSATSPSWIMNPREYWAMLRSRDDKNQAFGLGKMALQGNVLGAPLFRTTQIPKILNTDGDESEVYYVNAPNIIIADSLKMTFDSFRGGAYNDSSGTIQSGISNRQTVLRMVSAVDLGAEFRGNEIAVIERTVWDATA